jgi:hypothetical protein
MARHQRTHPGFVEGCYACRISSVQLAPSAMPTRTIGGDLAFQRDFAQEFVNGDREAYRRLRQDGLQPRSIRGSADLERHATTKFEVESGQVFTDKRGLNEALSICDAHGFDPTKASLNEKA